MSNIQDITSLSDLLATSPSQPLIEEKQKKNLQVGLATAKSLHDIVEDSQEEDNKRREVDSNGNENEPIKPSPVNNGLIENEGIVIDEGFTDDNDNGEHGPEMNDEEQELTELLNLRSRKLQLSEERSNLLKKRSSLKLAIEETRLKLTTHRLKKEDESTKIQLQELLENNTNAYLQKESNSNISEQEKILKELNVLPSQDWEHRLTLVKKFFTGIEIDKVRTYNEFNDQNELERKIEYTVISPLLFRLKVSISVRAIDDSIHEINIDKQASISLSDISNSFYYVFKQNYIRGKKMDLIMYGLNSLSLLTHRRVSIFHKIIRQFRQFVDRNRFQELIAPEELNNKIKLFSILKSVDKIDLVVPHNENEIKLCLVWEIELSHEWLGECESNIKLLLYHKDAHLGDISSLFLKLLSESGVMNALTIIFKTCFNIEIEAS